MTGPVPPTGAEDPFVVNRVSDGELSATVPFELERSEWELDGSADEAGESWGTAGDHGLE